MNKSNFLLLLVICLIISNIFTGYLVFNNQPNGPRRGKEGPRKLIIEKLHFDKNQSLEYDKLIDGHRKMVKAKNELTINLKNELYRTLQQDNANIISDSLIKAIAKTQEEIEQIHYNHFIDIKNMCNPEQQDDFGLLTMELSKIFSQKPQGQRNEKHP